MIEMTTKERGIIMTGESVRAIMEGRKTQTRRVVKTADVLRDLEKPDATNIRVVDGGITFDWRGGKAGIPITMPYGQPGNRLWVRETWATERQFDHLTPADIPDTACNVGRVLHSDAIVGGWHKRRSPIHMPRWASRLTLEITDVRIERVQDISEADVLAEGVTVDRVAAATGVSWADMPDLYSAFRVAWDHLNGKRAAWKDDPFVWVLSFRPV